MGKAARNRRNRQRQPRPAERLRREGYSGPLPPESAEAWELVEQVHVETEMPCRATFLDDPLFGVRAARVTGMTTGGDLITEDEDDAGRIPVLLFVPVHTIAIQDKVTGQWREGRVEMLVAAGWHWVPPRLLMIGMPADGWGLYRTAAGVELRDPCGGIVANGRIALDPQWVSAAVSGRAVMVFIGPHLGVRVPPGRSPESWTDQNQAGEIREGHEKGLLVTAIVEWHTGPDEETATWVLLPEGALGPPLPPIAYVPRLNLKAHGGPEAFGFASLAMLGREPMDIPIARDLAAQLTAVDVDPIRPGGDPAGRVAGYRNSAGPDDERFTAWRAAAARHGRILVISGSRDLLPRDDTSQHDLLDVIRASHGAVVLLTRESAPQAAPAYPAATTGEHGGQAEYSDMLTAKMRAQESLEVRIDPTVTDLIGQDSLSQWLTHLWPVACQTCGDPLGSKADISADGYPAGSQVLISAHHSACRPSGVTLADGPDAVHLLTVSVAAGYIGKPGKGPRTRDIPVMVVNPSCEQLLLERDGAGGWRNATLDEFAALGLVRATENIPPCIEEMQAELRGEQLNVTVTGGQAAGHEWVITPPAHVCEQVRRLRGLAICLITKTLPALLPPEHLPSVLADPDALVGWVHLSAPPPPRRWPTWRPPWASRDPQPAPPD